jgi:predicted nucleic acid-binding protein
VRAEGLIDTGAILALIDRTDRWHDLCVEAYASLRLPLATSAAVLAELFHMLGRQEVSDAWRFLRSDAIIVLPIGDADLPALDELMRKYADRPMDFADATLVHLAEREALTTVFTVDHADFETYRIAGRRRFRIVPGR